MVRGPRDVADRGAVVLPVPADGLPMAWECSSAEQTQRVTTPSAPTTLGLAGFSGRLAHDSLARRGPRSLLGERLLPRAAFRCRFGVPPRRTGLAATHDADELLDQVRLLTFRKRQRDRASGRVGDRPVREVLAVMQPREPSFRQRLLMILSPSPMMPTMVSVMP